VSEEIQCYLCKSIDTTGVDSVKLTIILINPSVWIPTCYSGTAIDITKSIIPMLQRLLYTCYKVYCTNVTKSIVRMLQSLLYPCCKVYCTYVTKYIVPILQNHVRTMYLVQLLLLTV
jgi:hypothetical protein